MSNGFRIRPLPAEVAERVRRTMTDDLGNRLCERRDEARHQCRSCLRLTEPDEPYLALSYRPFPSPQPFAECGPVYLHLRACQPYSRPAEWPAEFPREQVVLRAYGENHEICDARYVGRRPAEDVLRELLADPGTAYVHARNSSYGCFMFRIERG